MPGTPQETPDQLAQAHAQRTQQLYEARGALAEAVSALTGELRVLREQSAALAQDNRALHEQAATHAAAITSGQERITELETELGKAYSTIDSLRGLKVVRWTAWSRAMRFRLRRSRG